MPNSILQAGLINHHMTEDEIEAFIAQRASAAEKMPHGAERETALAQVERLRHYLFMKRLLRPNGPRATDPNETLSR